MFRLKKGFTLIELMVVVLIVGLLSSLVVVNVNNSRIAARDARRIADLGTISSALAAYYADNHFYPTTANFASAIRSAYIANIPTDPINVSPNIYSYTGCNCVGANCANYLEKSVLENLNHNPVSPSVNFSVYSGENTICTGCTCP